MFRLISIFFILILINRIQAQSNYWEIYAGASYSNVIHYEFDQQISFSHSLNAPLWNYGYQAGINRSWIINHRFSLTTGARIQLKGDKDSFHEVLPIDTLQSIRFLYAMIPINLQFKMLNSKNIFLKAGLSGNYLLSTGDEEDPTNYQFGPSEKLGISGQIGFNFNLFKSISAELMYSQDLTKINKVSLPVIPVSETYFRNQAFEFTLIKKL